MTFMVARSVEQVIGKIVELEIVPRYRPGYVYALYFVYGSLTVDNRAAGYAAYTSGYSIMNAGESR